MSTKLNAEELAAKRRLGLAWSDDMERAYAAAIREVAQPIADQRDELLEALKVLRRAMGADETNNVKSAWNNVLETIAKCTTP